MHFQAYLEQTQNSVKTDHTVSKSSIVKCLHVETKIHDLRSESSLTHIQSPIPCSTTNQSGPKLSLTIAVHGPNNTQTLVCLTVSQSLSIYH